MFTHIILPDLGQKVGDDHARPSPTIVPPMSMLYPAPSEPEHINITAINFDALIKA